MSKTLLEYRSLYKNGKGAHRRASHAFVQFCYLCAQFSYSENDWDQHCQLHLANLQPRCGIFPFRYTLVAAGLCPFCLGDETKNPSERFQQWLAKATLLNHIDGHMKLCQSEARVQCPHPRCQNKQYDVQQAFGVISLMYILSQNLVPTGSLEKDGGLLKMKILRKWPSAITMRIKIMNNGDSLIQNNKMPPYVAIASDRRPFIS